MRNETKRNEAKYPERWPSWRE